MTKEQTEQTENKSEREPIIPNFQPVISRQSEAIAKGIEKLSDEDRVKMFSNIERSRVPSLTVAYSVAENYGFKWLKNNCDNELRLNNSVNGERSKQLAEILKNILAIEGQMNMWQRMRGMIGI